MFGGNGRSELRFRRGPQYSYGIVSKPWALLFGTFVLVGLALVGLTSGNWTSVTIYSTLAFFLLLRTIFRTKMNIKTASYLSLILSTLAVTALLAVAVALAVVGTGPTRALAALSALFLLPVSGVGFFLAARATKDARRDS
jgi:hypothetical protein